MSLGRRRFRRTSILMMFTVGLIWLWVPVVSRMPSSHAASASSSTIQQVDAPDHPFGRQTESLEDRHVYDLANALSDSEIESVERDAARLQRHGVPALIITVTAAMSRDHASQVASAVRQDWNVASAPGADDGLVFLVVLPATQWGQTFATLSWGEHALPNQGLTVAASERVQQRWIGGWLEDAHVFDAVSYGVRRMIYHAIYDPAPAEPLSDARESAQSIVAWGAPIIAAGYVLARFKFLPSGRTEFTSSWPSWLLDLGPFLLALALGAVSVWAQSSIGIACTAVVLMMALVSWVRRDPNGPVQPGTVAEPATYGKGA